MRIAWLILAHQQPRQLARLLRALADPSPEGAHDLRIVHIEARVDDAAFRAACADDDDVRWLDRPARVGVRWGGFSMVRATLALLRAAERAGTARGAPFDRFVLLSGACYPLRPRAALRRALAGSAELMTLNEVLDAHHPAVDRRERVTRPHLMDHSWLNPRHTPVPRLAYRVDRALAHLPRLARPVVPTVKGSQWWALTSDCVRWMLRWLDEHPAHARFHAHALVPDESFFHSAVAVSPFAARLVHDATHEGGALQHEPQVVAAHYIDWRAPDANSPRTLTLDDADALRRSRALFARKFDERASAALLDRIDVWRADAERPA